MTRLALLDTSAWARLIDGRLTAAAADRVLDSLAAGRIAMTEPLILEILYAAMDTDAFRARQEELAALPLLRLDDRVAARALSAQADLASAGGISHRVKPIDLLVAAVADVHEADVMHYDRDYDMLAEHTLLAFESVWVAPRGSAG